MAGEQGGPIPHEQGPPGSQPPGSQPKGQSPAPRPGARLHKRCGWIGYNSAIGESSFVKNAAWFDAIHPDWYAINADSVSVRPLAGEGKPEVVAAARAHGVKIIPLVAGVENVSYIRNMVSSPSLRTQHVQVLVKLAVDKGWDGLDLDYEHLKGSDRTNVTAFHKEFAAAMHAAGKSASAAVEALGFQTTSSPSDYAELSQHLDQLHMMGYDYHSLGTHAGPCAPLGWIEGVAKTAAATGRPERFVLGLPNYGTSPGFVCENAAACIAACGGSYATTTNEMDSCSYNDRRYASGRAPNCRTAQGVIYFDDTASLEEKVVAAKAAGLGGITYWTVGGEPPGFFEMVRRYY